MENDIYPKVHVIVLNWNNKELTEQCLLSIQRIDYPNYEILIVDNNSSDGSVELFKNNFPDVKLLCLDKNLKYAGGNNAAIDYLSFNDDDFFLFLNNDTLVSRDFLHHLIDPFLNDSDCIISVPKILFSKESNAPAFTNPSSCSLLIFFGSTLLIKLSNDLNGPLISLSLTI